MLFSVWSVGSDGMEGREKSSELGLGLIKPRLKESQCSFDMDSFFKIGPCSWVGWVTNLQ